MLKCSKKHFGSRRRRRRKEEEAPGKQGFPADWRAVMARVIQGQKKKGYLVRYFLLGKLWLYRDRGKGVLGTRLWMSSTPTSSSFSPGQIKAGVDHMQMTWDPVTNPAAAPTPHPRDEGSKVGLGERLQDGVISPLCPPADRFCQSRHVAPVPTQGSPGRSSSPGASWI